MKIIRLSGSGITEGHPQSLPFDLGESGRGRTLVRVEPSSAPGKQPAGPPPVGPEVPYPSYDAPEDARAAYAARQERQRAANAWQWDVDFLPFVSHGRGPQGGTVFLLRAGTAPGPRQRGVLVRLNTSGTYTKGSCGSYSVVWGRVSVVAEGQWAEGDAGRTASGPDALLHVQGPAFIRAVLQGGEGKGWGGRCVLVTAEGRCWMGKTADLAALVTADERPDLAAVVRDMLAATASSTLPDTDPGAGPRIGLLVPGASYAPEDKVVVAWYQTLRDAVAAADALEADAPPEAAGVEHYTTDPALMGPDADWTGLLANLRPALTLPGGAKRPEGVDRVQAGCLMPGACSLVFLATAGGGKRYGHSQIRTSGVEVVARGGYDGRGYYSASESLLAIVTDPDGWSVEWEEIKDGQRVCAVSAGPAGVRKTHADGEVRTDPWA